MLFHIVGSEPCEWDGLGNAVILSRTFSDRAAAQTEVSTCVQPSRNGRIFEFLDSGYITEAFVVPPNVAGSHASIITLCAKPMEMRSK